MIRSIADILEDGLEGFWLYGSAVLDDFRLGWSDIDFVAFSKDPISEDQAQRLLHLRQTLCALFPDDPYYSCFEGVIACLSEYRSGQYTRLVYWGTTGQRIIDRYDPDAFSRYSLAKYGKLVFGDPDTMIFSLPRKEELIGAVKDHYDKIRRFAVTTNENLYSCGWILDIARCIYTLRYGGVIGKTQAGFWALEHHLFPDEDALIRTLEIRRNPLRYKDLPEVRQWLASLGPIVQRYADILSDEIKEALDMEFSLEQLTHENYPLVRRIDRSDIPESFVDTVDTLMETTDYGFEHGLIGHTYAVRTEDGYIGVLMLGEALAWPTDPPQMQKEPFYRLMGFVIDKRYRGMGIGGKALEKTIECVYKDFGVRPIALGCHEKNSEAARFYEKHGFEKTSYREGNDIYYLRYPKE